MNFKSMRVWLASLVLVFAIAPVASFTTPPTLNKHVLSQNKVISTTSSNHGALNMASDGKGKKSSSSIDGSKEGSYFLAAVLVANIWLFTIPAEFRRAHLYPEGNAQLYSDPKGITAKDWAAGVAQYYANGGGINFDFSVEGSE